MVLLCVDGFTVAISEGIFSSVWVVCSSVWVVCSSVWLDSDLFFGVDVALCGRFSSIVSGFSSLKANLALCRQI